MQGLVSKVLLIVPALVGVSYLYTQQANQKARTEIEAQLKDIKDQFATQVQQIVANTSEREFRKGIGRAVAVYQAALNKIYVNHPSWLDIGAHKKTADAQLKGGDITEAEHRNRIEAYALTRKAYEALLSNNWTSDLVSPGKGGTRMSIYGMRRIRGPDGHPLVAAQFFLWGVTPKTPITFQDLVLEYWKEVAPNVQVQRRRRRAGKDPKAPLWKPLGQAQGSAIPVVFIQDPSTRIGQFPGYVAIGTLWFPQVPISAKVMDLKYTYTVRKHGETYRSTLHWEKLPVSSTWRLNEDEPWIADEVEVSDQDMRALDAAE
ncbi:MAG: hypothetical protein KTR25_17960 [Myxococcales bacterium]|nr:hypothetical protein [Myxococcales bacterium]